MIPLLLICELRCGTRQTALGHKMTRPPLCSFLTGVLACSLYRCLMSRNQEYVEAGKPQQLKDGDEIAVIPPISGG